MPPIWGTAETEAARIRAQAKKEEELQARGRQSSHAYPLPKNPVPQQDRPIVDRRPVNQSRKPREPCWHCGEQNPAHQGPDCAQHPDRVRERALLERERQAQGDDKPLCDHRGRRIYQAERNIYILLRTPEVGPEPGIYHATWPQLTAICAPEYKLPQKGYGYRKLEEVGEGRPYWRAQGHRRDIPQFEL